MDPCDCFPLLAQQAATARLLEDVHELSHVAIAMGRSARERERIEANLEVRHAKRSTDVALDALDHDDDMARSKLAHPLR
jgi:hypothetical protein